MPKYDIIHCTSFLSSFMNGMSIMPFFSKPIDLINFRILLGPLLNIWTQVLGSTCRGNWDYLIRKSEFCNNVYVVRFPAKHMDPK